MRIDGQFLAAASGRSGLLPRLLAVSAIAAMLTACNSAGNNTVENTLDVNGQNQAAGDPNAAPVPPADALQDPRAFCPKTVLRAGTETYDVYPDKVKKEDEGSASQLRFRSTITETARECNSAGGFLNIRVGVRGRYLSGPKGDTGAFTMPVRIAVTRGDEVLYSQLHQIPAQLEPGRQNGTFSYVDNNVSIPKPDKENVMIYVGFDEGPYNTP
ncbi:MAG: hypothetical protein KDJ80_10690 [Nitratireductor sp.]|nr:hypothetical protein [Nitratireductor sp.]